MTDDKSLKELIFDGGQFAVGIVVALGFLWLMYQLGQIMERLNVTSVDPTQILTILSTGAVAVISGVVGYYFGSKSK